jgi:hypothetical protein
MSCLLHGPAHWPYFGWQASILLSALFFNYSSPPVNSRRSGRVPRPPGGNRLYISGFIQ